MWQAMVTNFILFAKQTLYIFESNREREREREKRGKITKSDEIIIANGSKHKRGINY